RVPYISVLTNPTTGGMYASFATQGDIIIAEPGALVGFAGPRVIQGVAGKDAGEQALRSHSAEFLLERGFIDSIVDRQRQRNTLATLLRLIGSGQHRLTPVPAASVPPRVVDDAWDVVQVARR